MFTGLIEEIGGVESVRETAESFTLAIAARTVLEDVKLGDSIAVNGVCLTVTEFGADQFSGNAETHQSWRSEQRRSG